MAKNKETGKILVITIYRELLTSGRTINRRIEEMIRYFRCANCHKRGLDKSRNGMQRFCDQNCYEEYCRKKSGQGIAKEDRQYCIYNDGVECYIHTCGNCGWNPVVAERRKAKIKRVARV